MTDIHPTSDASPSTEQDSLDPIPGGVSFKTLLRPLTLALCWAAVVFVVQECTTGANYPLPALKAVGSRAVRCLLDLLACGIITFLVRGWAVHVAILAWATVTSILLVYFDYYGRALSWTTISNHLTEALAMGPYLADLIHWRWFSLLVPATFGLLILARWMNRSALDRRLRLRIGTAFLGCWCLTAVVSTQFIDRVEKLKRFGTVDRLAMTNGYVLTWLGEWWHLDAEVLLRRATETALIKQDRLTPLETPFPLGDKLAIVQVESLDYNVLQLNIDEQPVMPFLANLATRSMLFRISAFHESGSCDADFVMLMNLFPSGDVTPYSVPEFDWSVSIAVHALASGYHSTLLHGNHSTFFNRGNGVSQMGFYHTLFREQLETKFQLKSKHWGISDEDVFDTSRDLLLTSADRSLHFIITLTSHAPFDFLDPGDRDLFAKPRNQRERYLNSMRYVDTQLKNYIQSLPEDSVIVVYGDHTSHVRYGQNPGHGDQYVPFLIHKVGQDLAKLQRTRGQKIATSGELTLLDAAGYVWSLFLPPVGQ